MKMVVVVIMIDKGYNGVGEAFFSPPNNTTKKVLLVRFSLFEMNEVASSRKNPDNTL